MDESVPDNKNNEQTPAVVPAISRDKILQPSTASIESIKIAQADAKQSQQSANNVNQTQTNPLTNNPLEKPELIPTSNNNSVIIEGRDPSQLNNPVGSNNKSQKTLDTDAGNQTSDDNRKLNLSKKPYKKTIYIAIIIFILGLGYFIFRSQFSAYVAPGKDVVTSQSDFQRYTLNNSTASLLFYEGSSLQPNGEITSPALSGDRLPLKLSITNDGYFTNATNPMCPINIHGLNTLDYSVYIKALNSTMYICKAAINPGGGPYDDIFTYFSNHQKYDGTITLANGSSVANYTRNNLNLYTTDLKTILASIQPS